MRNFIEKYKSSLSLDQIAYSKYDQIRQVLNGNPPVVWIPSWKFMHKSELEIIICSYGALLYKKQNRIILHSGEGSQVCKTQDVFDLLQQLDNFWKDYPHITQSSFYLGMLSYDLHAENSVSNCEYNFFKLPDFYIIIPGSGFLVNHTQRQIYQFQSTLPSLEIPKDVGHSLTRKSKVRLNENKQAYMDKIRSVKQLIRTGEVYQLNYTTRFSTEIPDSGFAFFQKLYQQNPAPYSVYAHFQQAAILSISPERFLMVHRDHVTTEPIKGTIRRGINPKEDLKLLNQLLHSEKDSAELSMIVDLLRNDLSTVCIPGSVKVSAHKRPESFKNVHHLVSTISGTLEETKTFIDILKNAFPGGSITGCPKIAAMHYINELEINNRSFYTGSFFIRFPNQESFDSNILIRTAVKTGPEIHFQAGGGITIDSDALDEYDELMAKADSFFKTLEH